MLASFRHEAREVARVREPALVVAEAEDKLQGFRRSRASRIRRRNGVGLQKMQDPPAGGCIAGHRRRSSLASRVLRSGDRHARRTYCGGNFLAALDATLASPGDHYRQKQASGRARIPGCLAAGEKASVAAGDFPVLSLFHGSSSHAEDGMSLPAYE